LKETVSAALSKEAQIKETKLEKDYQILVNDENQQNYSKVNKDIENLQRFS